jgi:hypothetical protein
VGSSVLFGRLPSAALALGASLFAGRCGGSSAPWVVSASFVGSGRFFRASLLRALLAAAGVRSGVRLSAGAVVVRWLA